MKNDITAHIVVKNEEQWIWYSIKSVINFVDQILIYDTGSKDQTVKIIKSINSAKIKFSQKKEVNPKDLVKLRNEQIYHTKTKWFMLVDGDDIWTTRAIKEILQIISSKKNLISIVTPTRVPIGDVFHYQEKSAGKYKIGERIGHYNIRIYKKQKDYFWKGIYPLEAYTGPDNIPIQSKIENLVFMKNEYWHMTHLRRSRIDHGKRKFEIGFREKVTLPEVFFFNHPYFVPAPFVKLSSFEYVLARIYAPLLRLKRRLVSV